MPDNFFLTKIEPSRKQEAKRKHFRRTDLYDNVAYKFNPSRNNVKHDIEFEIAQLQQMKLHLQTEIAKEKQTICLLKDKNKKV